MNMKVNIRELVKRCNLLNFYSPLCGECSISVLSKDGMHCIKDSKGKTICFLNDGRINSDGICLLFPSRELYAKYPLDAEKAWEEWVSPNPNRGIKTWEDVSNAYSMDAVETRFFDIEEDMYLHEEFGWNHIKSAIALLKIRKLIDVAYGGNPLTDDKLGDVYWFIAVRRTEIGDKPTGYGDVDPIDVHYSMYAERASECIDPIAFHTKEQAEEFISHESNRQLIRDFYMV